MLFIKSHINKEKIIKSPQKFKTPDPKVQIPAKNSNFQFKFPKNSPLKFKSTPKIPTFAPGSKKNSPLNFKSTPKIPTFAPGSKKNITETSNSWQKFQLSHQAPKKLSPKVQIIPQNTREIP